jgi:uncharacterized protein (TIGR02246 family)
MMISANGIALHAEESGTGDLALVFLHYWGGTARSWRAVIAALPADLRAIALDARGWGQSERPGDGYDIATMADDVEAAIAALDLKRYVLIGHSMGGKVAQLLASRRPSGLTALVLVAPSPAQGKSLAEAEREAMKDAYASPDSVAWTIDNVLAERALPLPLRDQVIADSLAGAVAARDFWPIAAISEDVSADLARIDVPVLVIGGEKDKVDSVDMLRSVVLPSLPGAVMTVIPGAGHLLPLEAPHELAEQILGFIGNGRGAARGATPRPEDMPSAFDAALNRGDLDAVMALFHPDATMRMTDGTVVAEDPDALRKALGGLIASRPNLRNIVRRVLVSDDVALLLLDWEIRITAPGGNEVVERGTATQVAERCADGNWKLRIANPLGIR